MTEIIEAVSMLASTMDADEYCEKTDPNVKAGSVELHKLKGYTADPAVLRDRMTGAGETEPKAAGSSAPWDLKQCSTVKFPFQTHHLIPKATLTPHEVCVWLTDSPKSNPTKYKLKADTDYSVDGAPNGYFMPFASTTKQWSAAGSNASKKTNICYEMMRRTKKQLHQGSHSSTDYLEDDDDIETGGYKDVTKQLLRLVSVRAGIHVDNCKECKKKKSGGKIQVPPLKSFVSHVNMVSDLLKALTIFNRIFVSRRAADYFAAHRDSLGNIRHPTSPFV